MSVNARGNGIHLKRLRSSSSNSSSSSDGNSDHDSTIASLDSKTALSSPRSPQSTKIVVPRPQLINTDLTSHWEYLRSQRLDPMSIQSTRSTDHSDFESGIINRDITEGIINVPTMFDPRLHLPNAPVGWKGYEEATPLSNELISYIAVRAKPLTVADFMRQALTHEAFGYYTNPTKPPIDDSDDFESLSDHVEAHADNGTTEPSNFIIGKKGDFVTAPEVSQVFGECLAVWFITQHAILGSPKEIQIVEVGPGKGTLIQDVVGSLCTSFHQKMGSSISKIHLVEASNAMRQAQRQKLEALDLSDIEIRFASDSETADESSTQSTTGEKQVITVHWYSTFRDFVASTKESQISTYVICQEFVDALPVHVFEKSVDGWRERMVDVAVAPEDQDESAPIEKEPVPTGTPEKKPRLRIVLSPNVSPACKTLLNVNPENGQKEDDDSPVGQVCEVCPEGILLMQDIAKLLQRNGGAALIVDYGQEGSTDSLRGFSRHQQVNFLSRPGQVDITADVDFSALRHAVNQLVVDVKDDKSIFAFGPITQGRFLASMGIVERVVGLIEDEKTTDEEAEDLYSALERLIAPEQMGERYKVLAIARKKDAIFAPPGF